MKSVAVLLSMIAALAMIAGCASDATKIEAEPVFAELDRVSPSVATTSAGFCPATDDCSGFVQLLLDGTLRGDQFAGNHLDLATVSASDVDRIIALAREESVIKLVEAGETCLSAPTDSYRGIFLNAKWGSGGAQICNGIGEELRAALFELARREFGWSKHD